MNPSTQKKTKNNEEINFADKLDGFNMPEIPVYQGVQKNI